MANNDIVLLEEPDPESPGEYYFDTGFAIGPHTILTASHALFDAPEQTRFTSIYAYPGYSGPDPDMGPGNVQVTGEHYNLVGTLGSDDLTAVSSEWDYAIVETSYTFTSWYSVSTNFPGGIVTATGYPGSTSGLAGAVSGYQDSTTGWVTADPIYGVLDHGTPGTLQTYSGMSGGPLVDGAGDVVGIVSTGSAAVELTSADWTEVQDWVYLDGYQLGPAALFQTAINGQIFATLYNGTEAAIGPAPGSNWQAVGTGDFNSDGRFDLLLQSTDGQLAVWDLSGTNLIGGGIVSLDPGASWHAVGTGNFTGGDTPSDILLQNSTSGQVAIWEMNGASVVGGGSVGLHPGSSWKAIGTGDLTGAGDSDILLQSASTGQLAIWEMNGADVIGGGTVSLDPGPSWKAIGTGDFYDNGHSDILLQNSTSGQVAIWEMNGTDVVGGGTVSLDPGSAWHAVGTDGGSNILFQSASGQAATWTMNGTNVTGGGAVVTAPVPGLKAFGLAT